MIGEEVGKLEDVEAMSLGIDELCKVALREPNHVIMKILLVDKIF